MHYIFTQVDGCCLIAHCYYVCNILNTGFLSIRNSDVIFARIWRKKQYIDLNVIDMKKFFVLLIFLGAGAGLWAQPGEHPRNVVKLSGGLDFVTSKVYLPVDWKSFNQIKSVRWQPGVTASMEYQHFWKSGLGFGLNLIYNDTRYSVKNYGKKAAIRSIYAGPSLAYSGCFNKHWRVDCAIGGGYGELGGDLFNTYRGFGVLLKGGIEYMITRHFGVGAELSELYIFTNDDELKYLKDIIPSASSDVSGLSRIGISAGMRFYF